VRRGWSWWVVCAGGAGALRRRTVRVEYDEMKVRCSAVADDWGVFCMPEMVNVESESSMTVGLLPLELGDSRSGLGVFKDIEEFTTIGTHSPDSISFFKRLYNQPRSCVLNCWTMSYNPLRLSSFSCTDDSK
jgi:hypothetical protein